MEHIVKVTTTGSAGSATGSGVTADAVTGFIEAIALDYTGVPATTDVTITERDAPARTILTRTDTATDGVFYPRVLLQGTDGANLTAIYGRIYVCGQILSVAVAQADAAANGLVARILVSDT